MIYSQQIGCQLIYPPSNLRGLSKRLASGAGCSLSSPAGPLLVREGVLEDPGPVVVSDLLLSNCNRFCFEAI